MSDYISATDIGLILPAKATVGASTVPVNFGEVGSMIAEVEAELNGAAANAGYAIPIASTASYAYALMQAKAKDGVSCKVLRVMFPNIGGPAGKVTLASDYCKSYEDFVKALRKGETLLIDAGESTTSRELARSFETSHGVSPSPVISMSGFNW